MFCDNCGAQLRKDAKFCHVCGASLLSEEEYVTALSSDPAAQISTADRAEEVRTKQAEMEQVRTKQIEAEQVRTEQAGVEQTEAEQTETESAVIEEENAGKSVQVPQPLCGTFSWENVKISGEFKNGVGTLTITFR